MIVRAIEPSDIGPVAKLLAELAVEFIIGDFDPAAQAHFLAKNNAAEIRGFIDRGFRYHVAESEGRLAGFVGVRDNSHLYHLFVAKSLQRRGIGRMLWEFAKRDCWRRGHRGAFTVNASSNAVPAYERLGFVRNGAMQDSNGIRYNPMRLEPDAAEQQRAATLS